MTSKTGYAAEIFSKGFNCAQAVLASHCEDLGLPDTIAKKISCGFGGGMGNLDGVCGAVAGTIMLIGLKYGKYTETDKESKEKTFEVIKKFTDRFKKEFGSINCTELIHHNLSNKDELLSARESGVFKKLCPAFVKRAVELTEELLEL